MYPYPNWEQMRARGYYIGAAPRKAPWTHEVYYDIQIHLPSGYYLESISALTEEEAMQALDKWAAAKLKGDFNV